MNPNREIEIYQEKYMRMKSTVDNRHDKGCREIIRLNFKDAYFTEYSMKLDSRIDTCKQLLGESKRSLEAGSNRQLKIDLRKFRGEKFKVDAQRIEVLHEIESLEIEADNLLNHSLKWQNRIELCQRALDGEDIPIWAEIQRIENEESEELCRDKPSCRKKRERE